MQYLGGKSRIAKPLAAYLEGRREGRYFVEPFCGGLNVTAQMTRPRLASDAHPALFSLYAALRAGWEPPDTLSQEEYQAIRARGDTADPLTAFAGFGVSFGGKWWGGYARNGGLRGYALSAKKSLRRKMAACTDVSFACCTYQRISPDSRCLVYCDPPYAGTTPYKGVAPFDSPAFWQLVREWASAGVTVLVSEYAAPPDFRCVWSIETMTAMHGEGRGGRTERLFEYSA